MASKAEKPAKLRGASLLARLNGLQKSIERAVKLQSSYQKDVETLGEDARSRAEERFHAIGQKLLSSGEMIIKASRDLTRSQGGKSEVDIADVIAAEGKLELKSVQAAMTARVAVETLHLLSQCEDDLEHAKSSDSNDTHASSFRDVYVAEFTDAFADELEAIRKNAHGEFGTKEMALLIDCIEDGMHFYDETDRHLFVAASAEKNKALEAQLAHPDDRPRSEKMDIETKDASGKSVSPKAKRRSEKGDMTGKRNKKGIRKSESNKKKTRKSGESPGKRSAKRKMSK